MTTAIQTHLLHTGGFPVATSHSNSDWADDIAKYDGLIDVARKIGALQTVLMEYVRETKHWLKKQGAGQSEIAPGQTHSKTIASFKAACPTLSEKVQADQIEATQEKLEAAQTRLSDTDAKLKQVQDRTKLLERKILTHEPETHEEAIDMIQFLSRLFKAHGKVEDEYLSHVLDACAQAAECPPNTAATRPYLQLAAA